MCKNIIIYYDDKKIYSWQMIIVKFSCYSQIVLLVLSVYYNFG